MAFQDDFYIINSTSYIKSVPTKLDKDFKKELINDNGDLKPHVEKIIENVFIVSSSTLFLLHKVYAIYK